MRCHIISDVSFVTNSGLVLVGHFASSNRDGAVFGRSHIPSLSQFLSYIQYLHVLPPRQDAKNSVLHLFLSELRQLL
jgi:hypothetical protein